MRREEPQGLEREDGEPSAADEGVNGGKKRLWGQLRRAGERQGNGRERLRS